MPHVIVKAYAGRSEKEKLRLAAELTKVVMKTWGYDEDSVSVAVEDVEPRDWVDSVYNPEILGKSNTLYKKPGYVP